MSEFRSYDPSFFGPVYWRIINNVCATLDSLVDTYDNMHLFYLFGAFIYSIAACLPCIYCRESLRMFLSSEPLYNPSTSIDWFRFKKMFSINERETFRRYSYELRMAVNTKLLWSNPNIGASVVTWDYALTHIFGLENGYDILTDVNLLETTLKNEHTPKLVYYIHIIQNM
jgi:hypothetical protein